MLSPHAAPPLCPSPRPADGYVRVYRFLEEGKRIELVHKTQVGGGGGGGGAGRD